jgi:hypothetical protein
MAVETNYMAAIFFQTATPVAGRKIVVLNSAARFAPEIPVLNRWENFNGKTDGPM